MLVLLHYFMCTYYLYITYYSKYYIQVKVGAGQIEPDIQRYAMTTDTHYS